MSVAEVVPLARNDPRDPGELTLGELAEGVNREAAEVEASLASAVYAAIRAGRLLLEARERVTATTPGGWMAWIEDNLGVGAVAVSHFMRLATYADALPVEAFQPYRDAKGRLRYPTPSSALNYVRGLPAIRRPDYKALPKEIGEEARRLRAEGATIAETARLLGIAEGSVKNYTIPGYRERCWKKANKRQQERKLAERALEKQREVAAAKAAGGDLSEIYSLIRKAADMAGRVESRVTGETRAAVRDALTQMHKAEDNISRAIRRSTSVGRAPRLREKKYRTKDDA